MSSPGGAAAGEEARGLKAEALGSPQLSLNYAAQPRTTGRLSHCQGHCEPGIPGTERLAIGLTVRSRHHSTGTGCKRPKNLRPAESAGDSVVFGLYLYTSVHNWLDLF